MADYPNLSDEINRNLREMEERPGVDLAAMQPGSILRMRTRNTLYTIGREPDGRFMVSGHPTYCPSPTPMNIIGSTWGGSMIRVKYLGEGMHMEAVIMAGPHAGQTILTSSIQGFEWGQGGEV